MKTLAFLLFLLTLPSSIFAKDPAFVMATTTTTENSGLLEHLLPMFEKTTGISVHAMALSTGQALHVAQNGDVDVLWVHYRPLEENFVAQGYGVKRHDVMCNHFLIVGPKSDPAAIKDVVSAHEALQAVRANGAIFISRGDNSGTHNKELELWGGTAPTENPWYREVGAGMGATLNMAATLQAYTLTDQGTWLAFQNKADMRELFQGGPDLYNPYGIILVNPEKHPHTQAASGQAFIDWITSAQGQNAINSFRIDGEQAFFANTLISQKNNQQNDSSCSAQPD